MKSSLRFRGVGAVAAVGLLIAATGALPAQPVGAVVSARPGQRTPLTVPPPEADGLHLSLDQAIRIALANNQDLNVSVNAAEASQFFLFQNTGIYDPLLTTNVLRNHTDTPASSQLAGADVLQNDTWDASIGLQQLTPWGGTVQFGLVGSYNLTNSTFTDVNPAITAGLSLGLSQPLLRNFGKLPTEIGIETSRNTRDASYHQFIRSVQSVINSVEQSYWDLVYARANLKVKLEARDIAKELNRITKIKIDVGSLAPIDIVQTEVGIATAEQDIITADALVGLAEDRLRRDLNYEADSPAINRLIPLDQLSVQQRQAFDLPEGVRTALGRRPEIVAQNYTVASNTLRYEYWKNQTMPQLDLVAGYGKNGLGGTFIDTQTGQVIARTNWWDAADQLFTESFKNWRVGLVFSYPILNRSAKGARGVAQYTLETSKANLTVLEQDVVLNVRDAHRIIETASRQIDARAKGQELAERNLDAARKKYDNGMTTSFEVSQIQNQLSDAQSLYLQSLAAYRKAVSAYHLAIADILDWKNVRIEGMPEDMAPPTTDTERAALMEKSLLQTAPAGSP